MTRFSAALAFVVAMLAAGAQAAALTPPSAEGRIVLPKDVVPTHYTLHVTPDAAHLTFTGSVSIVLDMKQATKTIEINAADLVFSKVGLSGVRGAPTVAYDAQRETATLTFPDAVSAGKHILNINYTGKINQHAAGLFALDYDNGKKRALYTQFENSDARRFLPCWDEPALKATFLLIATVPADEMAISNMPAAGSVPAGKGLKTVTFKVSPKMSSYLLFFGLGDFERIHKMVDGVDVGVVTTEGKGSQGEYALDAEAHILPYYEKYFGVKFPLPKLDLIAGPGLSQFFGAMENWGAIFFFERDVLIDPKISTEADKRGVYIVVAHETAHQWFGDLVTMAWWDDLWLNEGFAEWMETKATDQFHPEWKLWFDAMDQKESALYVDAREGTHPIIQPIHDVLQANEAFDTITYEKGQAVIWMLQDYVGAEPFRKGVQKYIKAHAYGPAVTDELWKALDTTSPVPVTEIAHDFTLQAGVPLITVSATKTGIELTQSRFAADESGKQPTVWHVPVIEKNLGAKTAWRGIVTAGAPADIAVPANAVPVVNAGQTGYFRTLYQPAVFEKLAAHFHDLAGVDQLGLVNDSRALGYSGYQPLSDFLELASHATPDMEPSVLDGIAGNIDGMAAAYRGLPGEAAFDAFGQRVLDPVFAKVGWEKKPGESQNVTLLRGTLLATLSQLNDKAVIAEADKRFEAYVKDPSSLSADLRRNVLEITAEHATPAIWDQLHTLAKNAKSSLERTELFAMLGLSKDDALAKKALDLALTDEAEVTTRPLIIREVSGYHPEMAFDFAAAHLDQVNAWLEPDSRNEFEAFIAGNSYDPATIGKLKAYAAAHIPPSAQQTAVKAEGKIAYYVDIREKRFPDVDAWLKAHPQ